jgi:copper(I)-binding protein
MHTSCPSFLRLPVVLALMALPLSACGDESPAPTDPAAHAVEVTPEAMAGADMAPESDMDAGLQVAMAWSRPTMREGQPGAVFMTLLAGMEDDRLTGVTSPRAARAEIHDHVHEDMVMRMVKLEGLNISGSSQVAFEPGGLHVMLFDLADPLAAGDIFPLILIFEKAGEITTQVQVSDGMAAPGMTHGHGSMKDHP